MPPLPLPDQGRPAARARDRGTTAFLELSTGEADPGSKTPASAASREVASETVAPSTTPTQAGTDSTPVRPRPTRADGAASPTGGPRPTGKSHRRADTV